MLRGRVVFDVCAAPFGSNFFFSCRTSEILLRVELLQLIAVFLLFGFMFGGLVTILGTFKGFLVTVGVFFAFIYMMRCAVRVGLEDLDRTLVQSPLVGSIYSVFFRKETYFRTDSRLCFIETVPTIVKRLSEDATAAKGIRLVRQYEVAPVLGELYKRCAFASSGAPIIIEDKTLSPYCTTPVPVHLGIK